MGDKSMKNTTQITCACGCGQSVKQRPKKYPSDKSARYAHGHTSRTHGHLYTPAYRSWATMIQRCTNPKTPGYCYYGGRGIEVCERWLKFPLFLADMGTRPDGTSLDRIDNDGNYEPSNCRWATNAEQANNKRSCHMITYAGETLSVTEWAVRTGINRGTIFSRLQSGWDEIAAITTPINEVVSGNMKNAVRRAA